MFEKFEKMPMSMIKLLSDEEHRAENFEKLLIMIETLVQVKSGKVDIQEASDKWSEQQNEQYFYPAFGGKEKLMDDINKKGGARIDSYL
jgi:hypothetical protein